MRSRSSRAPGRRGVALLSRRRRRRAATQVARRACAAAALASLLVALPAGGALDAVSGTPDPAIDAVLAGGAKEDVAYSLANGFPLWYRDASGLKLQLCVDQHAFIGGVQRAPCLTAEPFTTVPLSFPLNFGAEAIYWTASAFQAFQSVQVLAGGIEVPFTGNVLLVLSLEASFQNLVPIDGEQAVFSRIRIRAELPQGGTYRITHPYGQVEYSVPAASILREINQTQDIGNIPLGVPGEIVPPGGPPPSGDFTIALRDGPAPSTNPFDPAFDAGIVSTLPTGIGPFLFPATVPGGDPLPPVAASSGALYLSDPGTDLLPNAVPITGSVTGPNALVVELLNPPEGFFLNAIDRTNTLVIDRFQVVGRIFDDGPNAPPVALPDSAVTAKGEPVEIDVLTNDFDLVDPVTNRHGIDRQAIGLPSNAPVPGTILLTRPLVTANGGTVRRSTTFTTGEAVLEYTPAPGFAGVDTFEYVVQDSGGLVSAPATVTVLVEDLAVAAAEFRVRTGRWNVRGTSSAAAGNVVTLFASPRAVLAGSDVVPPAATGAHGAVTFTVRPDAIDFRLVIEPATATPPSSVQLHLGLPGETGPVVFFLHDAPVDGPFTGEKTGTLLPPRLIFVPSRPDLTIADVADALVAGTAYVDVRTTGLPNGELRGQVGAPTIGTAPVDPATGGWSFTGRSNVSPGWRPASVSARSSNGIRSAAKPLEFR